MNYTNKYVLSRKDKNNIDLLNFINTKLITYQEFIIYLDSLIKL